MSDPVIVTDAEGNLWSCVIVNEQLYGAYPSCSLVSTDTTTTTTVAPEVTTTTAAPETTTTTAAPQHVAVPICHATGNGSFVLIGADNSASHLEHGGGLKHGDQYPVDGACPTPATTTTAAPEVTTTTAAPVDTEAPTTTAGVTPTTVGVTPTVTPTIPETSSTVQSHNSVAAGFPPESPSLPAPTDSAGPSVPSSSVAVEVGSPPLPPLSTTTSVGVAPVPLPATGATSADTMAAGALVLILGAAAIVSTRIRRRSA